MYVSIVVDHKLTLDSPDIDVRKKALDIAMEMISSKNVEEVVLLLKKELTKTIDQEYEKVICLGTLSTSHINKNRTMNTDNFSFTLSTLVPSNFQKLLPMSLVCSWTLLVTSTIHQP